jgi:hypothetical protein
MDSSKGSPMAYTRISYDQLNAKQKEKYNYQKASAVFADYGFITIPLSDDWNGADFLAVPTEGEVLKIQLKGRLTFMKKYIGKGLHICFRDEETWYLYPHDLLLESFMSETKIQGTESWSGDDGAYSYPKLSNRFREILAEFKLS